MYTDFLDKDESEVYNFVKEYTKKKAFISIKEILPFLSHRLRKNPNFNSYKIEIILKNLIKKYLILPKTKLVKEDILNLPKREKIYDYILSNPSININQLIKNLKIGSNEILWHLNILEKFQFIRSINIQNQKVYFNFNLDIKYDKIFYYLKNEKIRKIIDLLDNYNEPLELAKISKIAKLHYNTTKKYMQILKNMELIKFTISNKRKAFTLNRTHYYELVKLVKLKQNEKF